MAVSEKIKALLAIKGKRQIDLADYLGITRQSMSNKFNRGSFSASDLIKIADFLGCELGFDVNENQRIILDMDDLNRNGEV